MRTLALTVAALALGAAIALAVPAGAATPRTLAGCFGHSGVQYDSHVAYECVFAMRGDGVLYWSQNLYVLQFYWHPAKGDMVVTETYYKPPGTSWPGVTGTGNPLVTPLGLPLRPRSNGRLITLADGCLVAAPSLSPVPQDCLATSQGGQAGEFHQMTTAEQNSVNGFWQIMSAAVPDRAW